MTQSQSQQPLKSLENLPSHEVVAQLQLVPDATRKKLLEGLLSVVDPKVVVDLLTKWLKDYAAK
jgi:hypothetical protein